MLASAEPDSLPPPRSAWHAGASRLRRRAPRAGLFMLAMCLGIAALLWAFLGGSLGSKLVYSFVIGFSCWGVTEAVRLAQALAVDAWRHWRGMPLDAARFASGWRGVLPAMLVMLLAGPPLGLAIADALTGEQSASLLQWNSMHTRMTAVLTVLGSLAAVFALSTMERLSSARAAAEQARRVAAEHHLKRLQAQLEPHMLFNTLANLRVLIGTDPARAQAMLDRLIALLRATLGASQRSRHALADEFAHLDDYLALMAIRMGPRLAVKLDLPQPLRDLQVPPLLLQPLVENGIKHGLEPKVGGGRLEVSARRDARMLVLAVLDSGIGLRPFSPAAAVSASAAGFGLQQVRERLRTVYGERATLTLQPLDDGGTLAELRLPIDGEDCDD